MHEPKRILVTGATGYVGSRLVDELLSAGYEVVATGRSMDRLAARDWAGHPQVRLVESDVLDERTLPAAVEGVDVAYYLVHSMGAGNRSYAEDDVRGAGRFARACSDGGVQRIVYLSGLGHDADQLSEHLQSRHDTGDALRSASVPVTELRAAIIIGSGSASFEIMRDLARKLPVMITPRWVRTRCEPIAIRDVLGFLVDVLDEPRTIGQTLEIGCGRVYTYAEMMRTTAREYAGRGILIIPVPVLTPRLSSWWLHLVTSVDASLARALIDGVRNDVVCHDTRITKWISRDRLDLPTAIALARRVEREKGAPSRWVDARLQHAPAPDASDRDEFVDERSFASKLSPAELFARVTSIGGADGYGAAQPLWRLRAALDRAIGGVGFRLGRPSRPLRPGDAVDFWRVRTIVPPHRYVLEAEMRLPGSATLSFTVTADGDGSRLVQRAALENTGMLARLYWYAVMPLHGPVFDSLGRHIARPGRG